MVKKIESVKIWVFIFSAQRLSRLDLITSGRTQLTPTLAHLVVNSGYLGNTNGEENDSQVLHGQKQDAV
jgi:hypothetical protein